MVTKLLPLFPPHKIYVEVFGGAASILLAKKPEGMEVYNDLNSGLCDFFRVISDPKLFAEFLRRVAVLPSSRELYYQCCEEWESQKDIVERVWRWYVIGRQSFGGMFGSSWGFSAGSISNGMSTTVATWLGAVAALPKLHKRLQRVQVENNDFRKIIKAYDSPDTFFYLDPPYVTDSRKTETVYKHEMTNHDHKVLVHLLLGIKGTAILSGYDNPIYARLVEAGWVQKNWDTVCFVAGRVKNSNLQGKGAASKNQPRVESVWVSPRKKAEGLFE
jgi:DNA adenine methylase